MPHRRAAALLTALVSTIWVAPATAQGEVNAPPEPAAKAPASWRLQQALGTPDWLRVSGMQRTRFESLDGQFRSGANLDDSDHAWAVRTTLRADVRLEGFIATGEFWDSRQFESDRGSVVDTGIVNAAEMVQLYVGYEAKSVFQPDDQASVIVGRHTMDLGSRRLTARNDFRNTTNTFLGVNAHWESAAKDSLQAFLTLPTRRLPGDFDSVLDNDVELDDENRHVRFWGLYATLAQACCEADLEVYYLGLDEQDAAGLATANRSLSTVGSRLVKSPATRSFDYELEATYQFGESRTDSASNTDLDHEAYFAHLEGGYTFDHEWAPRTALQFDYASGDDSPTDDENNRFDTLFGARRFDFGPTGILGFIARANIMSPALRVIVHPRPDVELMVCHRPVFLASDTDTFVSGGALDATGGSGDHVGDFSELRLRWNVAPGSWMLEFGAAYAANGEFLNSAPNASGNGDTLYGYVQSLFSF